MSIGIAGYPEDGSNIDAITARADRAMYQAKQQGRNRVVRFKID
ncbi:MAG: diguanylate cyclase [Burkholderiales bacterium]